MTTYPLCVATPVIGQVSETFVRRHMCDLLPGRTVALAEGAVEPDRRAWEAPTPQIVLREGRSIIQRAMLHLAYRRLRSQGHPERFVPTYGPREAAGIVRALRDYGVRAVMVEYVDFLLPLLPVLKDAGIRWYSMGHGYDVSQRLTDPWWRERIVRLTDADGVFVRAEVIRQRLIDLGIAADRVHVVRGGIDVPPVPPIPPAGDEVRVLAVGRMVPKKAPLKLLEAMRLALEEAPFLRLEIVGGGPQLDAARAFVSDNGLGGAVTLHGAQPPEFVAERLAQTSIFAQHSVRDPETGDEEGLPAAITEAMARAIPVVSTRHAGIPEAVLDGETGLLVDEGDAIGMSLALARLARSPELRQTMGLAGYAHAKATFTWEGERKALLDHMQLSEVVTNR